MTLVRYTHLPTPLGDLLATDHGKGLSSLSFPEQTGAAPVDPSWEHDADVFSAVATDIEAYFAGEEPAFAFPLDPAGTDLQRQVWDVLRRCPYGGTMTYGEVAREIGRPSAVRAVGGAIGRNPLVIVVPCHRVIGADGSLTGYAAGIERKRHLLELEGVLVA
jgi:methylated-DNA-[protein]-cysteine S-methyltransferase